MLEPLVPTDDKIEDFVDIKAGDLLTNSGSYKYGIQYLFNQEMISLS